MRKTALFICYAFLFSTSCVDPFKIPNLPFDAGLLVVDGFINSGAGSTTTIKLSRSMALNDNGKVRSELKAKVMVEADDNSTYSLIDKGSGTYSSTLNINPALKYRLRIKTSTGGEYLSDFVEVKHTPPIDSVTYQIDKSQHGLGIYVNTHDSEKVARNYHWEFIETWEYHADCNNTRLAVQTFKCWRSENSGKILFSSTARLEVDTINHFPLTFIDANSIKLGVTYSILVKQYAVTEDGLSYLQQLKKSTEPQGSIFDPQPGKVTGNFHCLSDVNEPVLGYLFVNNGVEKRIFIRTLPNWFFKIPFFLACSDPLNPGFPIACGNPPASACSDCRVGGGVIVRPDFWID